ESFAQSATELIRRSHKIRLANVIVNLAEKEGAGGIVDEIPLATKATSFKVEQIKQQLEELGADIPQGVADELLTVFQHTANYTGKDNVVAVWRQGKLKLYEIHPEVYRSLQAVEPMQVAGAMKVVSAFTRMLRLGATGVNPSFGLIRNPVRDALTYATFSKSKLATPIDPMKGIILDLRDSDKPGTAAYRFKAAGGDISTQMGYDRAQTMAVIDDALLKDISKSGKTLRIVKHPIDVLRRLVNIPELGPRIIELEKSMLRYKKEHPDWSPNDQFIQAFNDAQDVTVNFSKSGNWGKWINQGVFAFNASTQGINKFYRQMRTDPVGTALRGMIWISLASVAFWYRNRDEEWYQNLPPEAKYKNIYIEFDDQIVRLPIPYDLGVIFSAMPLAVLDAEYLKSPEQYDGLIELALSQVPNPWPPDIIGPLWDVARNKNYLNEPIESKGTQHLPSEYRVRPYTAEWAKQLSKGLNQLFETTGREGRISPVQLEYLVQNYTGGIFRNLPSGKAVKEPADLPVVGTMFQRMPEEPQSWVNKFYDRYTPLQEKKSGGTLTTQERVELNRLQVLYNSAVKPSMQRVRKLQAKDDRDGLRREYLWLGKQLRNSRWLK
ncbi:MAG: hypothetical protein HYS41_04395, partial [Candidatus Omnitrophica bacterium]|nr:hypothetical protein [Candidatus Omnitrophota bacterium]